MLPDPVGVAFKLLENESEPAGSEVCTHAFQNIEKITKNVKVYLQTGVYLSVERSNTVTRPSPDTVANTVLWRNINIIFFSISFTLNKEPKRHHQRKHRGQIYERN